MSATAALTCQPLPLRYSEREAQLWVRRFAPCSWQRRIDLEFRHVPLNLLQHGGSSTDPARVDYWIQRIQTRRTIPALIGCETEPGTFYLFDGNHRYQALQEVLRGEPEAPVRVGVPRPHPGYEFRYRWFRAYGTYVLEPAWMPSRLLRHTSECFPGRTMILVAHPDDETGGCAGLLQRLHDSLVVYATDGAPEDEFFWGAFGSQRSYAALRRYEAATALSIARVEKFKFLSDDADGLFDQRLYRALPRAFAALTRVIMRHQPDTLLVPAYEGGHPDHDACSFLGSLARTHLGLNVWEMPLYHRSDQGALVTQRFRRNYGSERMLHLTRLELQRRQSMIHRYSSQRDLGRYVTAQVEYYRPQPQYNYSRPPHPGKVNYELWEWPITALEVCRAFEASIAALVPSRIAATASGSEAWSASVRTT
jgi:LmbE family N-acetylglucosaminyl deacetylase